MAGDRSRRPRICNHGTGRFRGASDVGPLSGPGGGLQPRGHHLYPPRRLRDRFGRVQETARALTDQHLGYMMAAFMIGYGLFEIPWGFLGDRFGVRTILAAIILGGSTLTACLALVAFLPRNALRDRRRSWWCYGSFSVHSRRAPFRRSRG